MQFLTQWTGVSKYMFTNPGTFFDRYDESHGLSYPLLYLLFTTLVAMAPFFLLAVGFNATEPGQIGAAALIAVLFAAYFWVISIVEALIAHGVLYLFGARGVTDTLEAYAFPAIVRYGLWWFPIVNIGLGFYGLYLQIVGLSKFHDVSTGKAAVAGILALILYLPVTVIVVAVVATFVFSFGGGAGPGGQPMPAVASLLAF